jgi:hypothetical protein
MSANLDQYLPAMFRRRKPGLNPFIQNNPDDAALSNIAMAQDPARPVFLPPQSPDTPVLNPIGKNPALPPAAPVPNIAEGVQPAMPEYQTPEINAGRAPLIETDSSGHPKLVKAASTDNPLDRAYQEEAAVANYEPEKTHGWWNRFLKPILKGAGVGFMHGGIGGAIGGGAYAGIQGAFNPKAPNEQWKNQHLRQAMGQVKVYEDQYKNQQQREKGALDLTKTEADIELARARTKAAGNAKWQLKQDKSGVFHPVNTATGLDPEGKPVEGRMPAASSEWELRVSEDGTITPTNKKTGLDQNGNKVTAKSMVKMEDGTFIDATEKYKADTANDQADVTNTAVDSRIKQIRIQQGKIDKALETLPPTIQKETLMGTETVENPEYRHAIEDRNRLDAEIGDLELKRKAPRKMSVAPKAATKDPLGILQ